MAVLYRLARRARMDHVEALQRVRECVRLVELKGKIGLRIDVHAHNLEAGSVVAHGRTARATEEVK